MGSSLNDSKLTGMIPMPEAPVMEMSFLLHELEVTADPSPALAEHSFKEAGLRYFLESDSDSGRREAADETDLRISSSEPTATNLARDDDARPSGP